MYKIKTLSEYFDDYKDIIIKIYLEEWGWHYTEWDIKDYTSMLEEITKYKDTIYVLIEDNNLIGTVALMDCDIKMYLGYTNWMTCLYVKDEYRKRGYGKILIDFIKTKVKEQDKDLYLWCYNENEFKYDLGCGFELVEIFIYNYKRCYLMKF